VTSEPDLLLVDRVGLARILKVSPRQVSRLHDAGRIPAPISLGTASNRWLMSEIEAWLRAGGPRRREWENLRSAVATPRTGEA
jgi:predicted DNA-binding transcriptional regulator AlpA